MRWRIHEGGAFMKMLLRRDQKKRGLGGVTFILDVRAELSEEEQANIKRYNLGSTMLYEKMIMTDGGAGILGFLSRLWFKAKNLSVSVSDLTNGKRIECRSIVEMVNVEEELKEAAQTFKQILETAARFGGEEVVEY